MATGCVVPAIYFSRSLAAFLFLASSLSVLAQDGPVALPNTNLFDGVDVIKTRGTQRAGLPETDPRQQVYTERQLRVVVKERGTWFVPTYVTMDAMNEEKYNYVLRLRGKHMVPQLERAIREAIRIGVKIANGADHYYEEDAINRISIEVERFVEFGMSNFDALQTATVDSAELLQMDDRTGRIEEGFEADLILVPGNPLTNIEVLQDVLLVMSDGRLALKRIPFAVAD